MKSLSKYEKWISTDLFNVLLSNVAPSLYKYIKDRAKLLFNIKRMVPIRLSFFNYGNLGIHAPIRSESIASHDEEDMAVVIYPDIVKEVYPNAIRDGYINIAEITPYIVHEAIHLLQKAANAFEISDDYYEGPSELQAYEETVRTIKDQLSKLYDGSELRERVIEVLQKKIPRASKEYWESLYEQIG